MFGPSGVSYVYFSYGFHCCFNVVCDKTGVPGAVLIRALEPMDGIKQMQKRRGKTELKDLCSGPGKLCQAMGINLKNNGDSLFTDGFHIQRGERVASEKIITGPRIGISKSLDLYWRFGIAGNSFISRKF